MKVGHVYVTNQMAKFEGTTCRIGDDNSGYFAFHCGGNFNIGCIANTTIDLSTTPVSYLVQELTQ